MVFVTAGEKVTPQYVKASGDKVTIELEFPSTVEKSSPTITTNVLVVMTGEGFFTLLSVMTTVLTYKSVAIELIILNELEFTMINCAVEISSPSMFTFNNVIVDVELLNNENYDGKLIVMLLSRGTT